MGYTCASIMRLLLLPLTSFYYILFTTSCLSYSKNSHRPHHCFIYAILFLNVVLHLWTHSLLKIHFKVVVPPRFICLLLITRSFANPFVVALSCFSLAFLIAKNWGQWWQGWMLQEYRWCNYKVVVLVGIWRHNLQRIRPVEISSIASSGFKVTMGNLTTLICVYLASLDLYNPFPL